MSIVERLVTVAVGALALGAPAPVSGQLADQVFGGADGRVRLSYPARPGVEICRQGIRLEERQIWWRSVGGWDPSDCRPGPVEVELRVEAGRVRDVDIVLPRARGAQGRDLGLVESAEAARFLLAVAREADDDDDPEDAVLAAALADVPGLWRELVAIGRDRRLSSDVRRSAVFWLGYEAAETVTPDLAELAADAAEQQEIRDAAIFALSQRPEEEGIPILLGIARSAAEPDTRRSAMFWLAQSDDERVVAFFEEILLGSR